MITLRQNSFLACALTICLFAPNVFAQEPEGQPNHRGLSYSVSLTPFYQPTVDLDGGGRFSVSSMSFGFEVSRPISQSVILGFGVSYNFDDYDFSDLNLFDGASPWSDVNRFGFAVPIIARLPGKWSLFASASADYLEESGADRSDSLTYGSVLVASRNVRKDRRIGFGLGVFKQLEEITAFPALVIDWHFTDRLRLANPFAAGPTGPAGLELVYKLHETWEIAGGGAFRSIRFRLDDRGLAPNGVGENSGMPGFLRLTRRFGPAWDLAFSLYAGAILDGELRLEDNNGDKIASDDYETAPFLAFTLEGEF